MCTAFQNHYPSSCTKHGGVYSRPCPILYQLRPGQLGFVHIHHTIDERNPTITLETCDRCKRREQKHSWLRCFKVLTIHAALPAEIKRVRRRTHNVGSTSSTVLNTSDHNYYAMLKTEPLDTANIVDVPAEVIHSSRLPDKQRHRHRRGTTLTDTTPVGAHGNARTSRAPSTGVPGPASPTSSCICSWTRT